MSIKVALGNAMSQWVASLVLRAEKKGVPFWVENPSGSYMWKQPEWIPIVARFPWFPHRLLSVGNSMEEENSFRWLVLRQWEAPTLSVWQTACQVGGLQQGIQDELDETC